MVSSTKMLAGKINSNFATIRRFMDSEDLFRGGWYFTNGPISDKIVPQYDNQYSPESLALFDSIKAAIIIRKAVFLFDAYSKEYIRTYNGVIECAKNLKLSHNTIKEAMTNNSRVGKYIFSTHRVHKPNQ